MPFAADLFRNLKLGQHPFNLVAKIIIVATKSGTLAHSKCTTDKTFMLVSVLTYGNNSTNINCVTLVIRAIKLLSADFCNAYSTNEIRRRKKCSIILKNTHITTKSIVAGDTNVSDILNTEFQLIYGETIEPKDVTNSTMPPITK
jgi:hypothetical protein